VRITAHPKGSEFDMVKVARQDKGKTLYIELSIFPCGGAGTTKNLTISCPNQDMRFKTILSDAGLRKFRAKILEFYSRHVVNAPLIAE
jgi:hypothetical protein